MRAMTLAWIFTLVGLGAMILAIFDGKATKIFRLIFLCAGFVYAFVGIWLIIKLY